MGDILEERKSSTTNLPSDKIHTVEREVLTQLKKRLGGCRGALESACPIAVFALSYSLTSELLGSLVFSASIGIFALIVRLIQRSSVRFALQGLAAIAIGGLLAMVADKPENVFLPDIIQAAVWVGVLGVSLLAGRPLMGYLIGAILDEPAGWYKEPSIKKVSNRLTLVLLLPMIFRVAIQLPLYMAGNVGWLGITTVALGWPLHLATLAAVALILASGRTPLPNIEGHGYSR